MSQIIFSGQRYFLFVMSVSCLFIYVHASQDPLIFIIFSREFVTTCKDALDLNAKLISTEQKEYHESLKTGFMEIAERLSILLGEKVSSHTSWPSK